MGIKTKIKTKITNELYVEMTIVTPARPGLHVEMTNVIPPCNTVHRLYDKFKYITEITVDYLQKHRRNDNYQPNKQHYKHCTRNSFALLKTLFCGLPVETLSLTSRNSQNNPSLNQVMWNTPRQKEHEMK